MGSAAGAAGVVDKENVKIGGEETGVDADALELVAASVEEDKIVEEDKMAEVTGIGARVEAVGAEQSVAETVTVETRVTVTKPSVPITTVGVTTLPVDELVVAGVITGTEAEAVEETMTGVNVRTLVEEAVGVEEMLGVLRVRI